MDASWPWLLVAGAGALHGLNPATGWLLAAGQAWHVRDPRQAWRALLPLAAGHLGAIGLVAGLVARGGSLHRDGVLVAAAAVLVGAAAAHGWPGRPRRWRAPAGQLGLALWSFMLSTAHGAGLALVPALVPLCLGAGAGGHGEAPQLLLPALAAVAVHAGAMLAVTGALAALACRAPHLAGRWRREANATMAAPDAPPPTGIRSAG